MLDYPKTQKQRDFKIRPHHGLCAEFFRGEGYDSDFVRNMSETLSLLNECDPPITLTEGADLICGRCPNNVEAGCTSAEKVSRYDDAVLEICGFSAGDSLRWQKFRDTVREKIITENRLGEICSDCCWYGICGKDK